MDILRVRLGMQSARSRSSVVGPSYFLPPERLCDSKYTKLISAARSFAQDSTKRAYSNLLGP